MDSNRYWKMYRSETFCSSSSTTSSSSASTGGGSTRHAGEQKVGPYKLDGLLLTGEKQVGPCSKTIFEGVAYDFYGCYYHGCPVCYPNRSEFNKKLGATMESIYFSTVQTRIKWLQDQISAKRLFYTGDGVKYVLKKIEVVWECRFKMLLLQSDHISNTTNDNHNNGNIQLRALKGIRAKNLNFSPLKARDAFVGGRTENFYTRWHKQDKSSEFHYVDICSLYPYVNSTCQYPVGHPDEVLVAPIFAENNSHPLSRRRRSIVADQAETCIYCHDYTEIEANLRDETYFGLIKCLVLPPRDLLIPVLPFKANGKLLFPLCRKCVEESSSKNPQTYVSDVKGKSNENCGCASTSSSSSNNKDDDEDARVKYDSSSRRKRNSEICSHSNCYDRAFWGTFVTVELKKALDKGYRILDVCELWSWNRAKRSNNLFRDYNRAFLKIKSEASGWPECSCI